MSSILVWVRDNDPHPDPALASWVRHQPGDVIAVHPDSEHHWGDDIARLGWWVVLKCFAPADALSHLLVGDEPSVESHVGIRRLRKQRLDLTMLPSKATYSLDDLAAVTRDVPAPEDYNLIG